MRLLHNGREFLSRWERRASRFRLDQEALAVELAPIVERASRQELKRQVYAVPIPRSRTGRPLWTRTGELMDAEQARSEGVDVVLENLAAHAIYRATLGTSGGRQVRSPGIQVGNWQQKTLKVLRPFIFQQRRNTMLKSLRG